MMDVSRRSFLRGALTVAAVAVAAPVLKHIPAVLPAYPVMYGDMVHDDGPAIQALLNGEPFLVEGEVVTVADTNAVLRGGVHMIKSTVHVYRPDVMVTQCMFRMDMSEKHVVAFHFHESAQGLIFTNCIFCPAHTQAEYTAFHLEKGVEMALTGPLTFKGGANFS